ncbi:hypothetical protein ACFYXM_03560 [Streptomyces sp. NPDC002476]|uniref:hypothetical protein n=1 Tax=Streptomyces sp. NPDC002476 TaxID=3364648 RepID=UPI00367836A2
MRAGRRLLTSLLFAVLTVVGGAPAAAGALYAGGPFAGAPPPAARAPEARQPIPHTDRTARTVTVHDSRRARTVTATDGHRPAPTTGPGPGPGPRAGAEHNRAPQQLPPSDSDVLLPGAPGIRTPHLQPRPVPAALSRTIDRFRVALPGVRGPPRTAVHRPPAPVRVSTPARPPVAPSH